MSSKEPSDVNCSHIIQRLWSTNNVTLTHRQAKRLTKKLLGYIGEQLCKGNRVEIRKFGSFSLTYRKSRMGRNPRENKKEWIPAKNVVRFRVGRYLYDELNSGS